MSGHWVASSLSRSRACPQCLGAERRRVVNGLAALCDIRHRQNHSYAGSWPTANGSKASEVSDASALHNTRAAYDAVASLYAEHVGDWLRSKPLERALLTAFAELVQTRGTRPVADIGCGPGYVTAHMHTLGPTTFGIDLSSAMVAQAREAHPELRFIEGSMATLDLADEVLGGILAIYSIIHIPPRQLPAVFTEFHRVLAPDGHLLLGFFAGNDPVPEEFDHKVSRAYRWSPDGLAELLRQSGFVEVASLVREPGDGERFQQAHLRERKR
jgi:SAM-dependent methyltransferase